MRCNLNRRGFLKRAFGAIGALLGVGTTKAVKGVFSRDEYKNLSSGYTYNSLTIDSAGTVPGTGEFEFDEAELIEMLEGMPSCDEAYTNMPELFMFNQPRLGPAQDGLFLITKRPERNHV